MTKGRKEISLDTDVIRLVNEKTETGELCLSRLVNTILRERYKDDLSRGPRAKK